MCYWQAKCLSVTFFYLSQYDFFHLIFHYLTSILLVSGFIFVNFCFFYFALTSKMLVSEIFSVIDKLNACQSLLTSKMLVGNIFSLLTSILLVSNTLTSILPLNQGKKSLTSILLVNQETQDAKNLKLSTCFLSEIKMLVKVLVKLIIKCIYATT